MKIGVKSEDGVYEVNFMGQKRRVYCDTTQDGGGWMLAIMNHEDRD